MLRTGRWIILLILLNSAYLAAMGSPTFFYVANIFAHLFLGLAVLAIWGVMIRRFFKQKTAHSLLTYGTVALIIISAGTGIGLVVFGNLRPQQPLLLTHIIASLGACGGTLWWFREKQIFSQRGFAMALIMLGIAVIAPFTNRFWYADPSHTITNPRLLPLTLAGEGMGPSGENPFFPSAVETIHGDLLPVEYFLNSKTCGDVGCHPDIYAQWESSMHHFSSFNNQWYRKSIEYMQEVVGLEPPQWCAGCHDQALLLTGQMAQPVADFLDTPASQAGIGCIGCHGITEVKNTTGNAAYIMDYPYLSQFITAEGFLKELHDFVVRVDPEPHRRTFLKPFHREQVAEFCSTCHKVHLDVAVNQYKWIRGFNSYDNWQASGVSGQGARSFYYPPEPLDCADCHMPLVPSDDAGNRGGFVHSHRFATANTAVTTANLDTVQTDEIKRFLKNNQLKVDLFTASTPSALVATTEPMGTPTGQPALATTFAIGEEQGMALGQGSRTTEAVEVLGELSHGDTIFQRGTSARLDVVTRTLAVGHFFPSGTVDAQEAWLEVKAVDNQGRVIFWSGWVDERPDGSAGEVDPSAHFFRTVMVDGQGNRINKRNAWASRSVVYVNLIPPGAADVAHYRLHIPPDVGDEITLTAKLHYRKFDWWHTQFSFAGIVDPATVNASVTADYDNRNWIFDGDLSTVSARQKSIPDVPIVTMAVDSVVVHVADAATALQTGQSETALARRMRWNDYGIGLLREGDLKGAEQAFRQVTELDALYTDGWINLARVYLQEGALDDAEAVLDQAQQIEPDFHKTYYFRGLLHKARGEYPEAIAAFETVLVDYPKDRVVQNELGRSQYLNGAFAEAVAAFNRVLEIDAEDLMAHYNLMLSYRALGDLDQSKAHEQRYLRYKEDESAQAIARAYRQTHPHDNNEAQPIHEHGSQLRRGIMQ